MQAQNEHDAVVSKRNEKNFQKPVDRMVKRAYTNEVVSSEAAGTAETLK